MSDITYVYIDDIEFEIITLDGEEWLRATWQGLEAEQPIIESRQQAEEDCFVSLARESSAVPGVKFVDS